MKTKDMKNLRHDIGEVVVVIILIILAMNAGKWLGIGLFNFLMWSGLNEIFETFFSWLII